MVNEHMNKNWLRRRVGALCLLVISLAVPLVAQENIRQRLRRSRCYRETFARFRCRGTVTELK